MTSDFSWRMRAVEKQQSNYLLREESREGVTLTSVPERWGTFHKAEDRKDLRTELLPIQLSSTLKLSHLASVCQSHHQGVNNISLISAPSSSLSIARSGYTTRHHARRGNPVALPEEIKDWLDYFPNSTGIISKDKAKLERSRLCIPRRLCQCLLQQSRICCAARSWCCRHLSLLFSLLPFLSYAALEIIAFINAR